MSKGHRENVESSGAGSVVAAQLEDHRAGGGAIPTSALHSLLVKPISMVMAGDLLAPEHYLHSFPGGTQLAFGVFEGPRLQGALTLGAGPANAYALVEGARPGHCLVLTRLWHSDELPSNSESRVLGIVLRALRRNTEAKFLISYADPTQGHVGSIYQATNWLYTGLSQATPLYDIGDGRLYHSRTLSQILGTHSLKYLRGHGVQARLVPQEPKHRYVYFLDPSWKQRFKVPVLPYPKRGMEVEEIKEARNAVQ